MNDALLASLVAFCVTLLAFLFMPAIADEFPGLAVAAAVYLAILLAISWVFRFSRRKLHK